MSKKRGSTKNFCWCTYLRIFEKEEDRKGRAEPERAQFHVLSSERKGEEAEAARGLGEMRGREEKWKGSTISSDRGPWGKIKEERQSAYVGALSTTRGGVYNKM